MRIVTTNRYSAPKCEIIPLSLVDVITASVHGDDNVLTDPWEDGTETPKE